MYVARLFDRIPVYGNWGPTVRPRLGLRGVVNSLENSLLSRHLLFGLATVVAIGLTGYRFGTMDQTLLIPFLKHSADPSLYAADPFTALMGQHTTFFWSLFLPVYRLGLLEPVVFAAFVLVTYLTFWAVWSLSQALFENSLASAIAVAGLAFPHLGLAGFPLVEFSLLCRNAVLPFLLWALTLYVRRHTLLAFGLLGLLYNFHVISVNFGLGLVLFAAVCEIRQVGVRKLALGLAAFVVAALPVLAWKSSGTPIDLSLRPEWLALLARGGSAELFYLVGPQASLLVTTLSGVAAVAMFFIARRLTRPGPQDQTALRFMIAVLLFVAVEVVASHWLPVTIVIELQLIRAGIFALLLGYLYFARYLAAAYQPRALGRGGFGVLLAAYCLAPLAFILLAVWAVLVGSRALLERRTLDARRGLRERGTLLERRTRPIRTWRVAAAGGLLAGLVGVSAVSLARLGYWSPGVYVSPQADGWYAAQTWARSNTPQQAVFITPPQIQGYYQSGWRVFSERATVVAASDLTDVAYSPGYLATWQPRFEAVAPGALARFNGDPTHNMAVTAQAFYGLTDGQLMSIAREYGARYVVVEKPHLRPWPVVYQNQGFVIYDLGAK
jgi:hypothetical protein